MENKVKRFRRQAGLTQVQLSTLSGVPQSTISEIEDGNREPSVGHALRLARALGLTVEDLFIL